MAATARVDGQEKVLAAAQHIVKSLATSKNAAEDMIRILSGFDNRLSIMNDDLFPPAPGDSRSAASGDPGDAGDSDPSEADSRVDTAEKFLLRWDPSSCDSLLWEAPSEEIADFLAAVDEVISFVSEPQASPSAGGGSDLRCRAESALQIAMFRLEEEFRYLMIQNTVPLNADGLYGSIRRISLSFASDSGDNIEDFESSVEEEQQQEGSPEDRTGSSLLDDRSVDLIRPEAIANMIEIADRMILAQYGRELHQVYCSVRREILDECLVVLGVDRMSIEEVQRIEWRLLDDKMKKWIQAVKIVSRVLLMEERRLCNQIFGGCEELKDECFTETAKSCVMQLLNFGDAIAICQRSSEKLFRVLDMYEALAEVMPDLQALFLADARELISGEAEGILRRLGDAVRGTLLEFETAVQREASRRPMQAGEIHPLTRYVMNYVRLLVVYSDTLDMLLDDGGMEGGACPEEGESDDGRYLGSTTPMGRRLLLLMSYLESNLEEKSKLYEDGAMQYIFLMNNILYIVQKVKDSELRRLLGDHWVRKRRGQIRQYATSYLRTSWTKALSYLRDDGFGSGSGSGSGGSNSVSKMALKERFKSFNLAFEEICRVQTAWKVPDPQLREELRISISEKVIPAYRSFMGRFGGQLDGGRHAAKYVKYTPEDLENQLLDLFEGLPGPANHPRRKS